MKNAESNSIHSIIDALPEQAKRNVLFSLVGSLNASIIGSASSVVARLTSDDYDFRELEASDVIHMLNEMDGRQDFVLNTRKTVRVAQVLRDQLIAISNNDEDGDLLGTLEFMTRGTNKGLDMELLKATLEAAGIKGVDPKHFEAMHAMNQAQRAARLSAQRGHIEWLIDHVLTGTGAEDGYDEAVIDELQSEQIERLQDKLVVALNRARDNTVLGVLSRDKRYSLGDLPLISAAITDAEHLLSYAEAEAMA